MRVNNYLKNNLDLISKEAIPNKWDSLIIVFGKEGTGKSTLAMQIADYLDKDFNLENVVFTPEQFENAIENCPEQSSIVWDEAITGANIARHASDISLNIVSKLTQIRRKRLKIILCFPYLYMLNKYFISRCIASIYVYAKGFDDRGHAFFYSNNQTEFLYNQMKDKYRYHYKGAINRCKKSFFTRFNAAFPLDHSAYEVKKIKALTAQVKEEKKNIWKDRLIKAYNWIKEQDEIKAKEFAAAMGVSPSNLSHAIE